MRITHSAHRLADSAHTSRPWRIHEIAPDFRLEDVWELPGKGGAGDFARLVRVISSFDPSHGSSRLSNALFALRWKLGELLGWDDPRRGVGARVPTLRDRLPADLRGASSGRDRKPDGAWRDARRGDLRRCGRLSRPDGGPREAQWPAWRRVHGRDQTLPPLDRLPAPDARRGPRMERCDRRGTRPRRPRRAVAAGAGRGRRHEL